MKTSKCLQALTIILLIALLIAGCGQKANKKIQDKDHLEGYISISGAFALYPMTVKWAEEFKKKNPKVRIDISAGGAGKGMTDALSGMVDLGMFSREVTQAEIDKGAWYIAVTKDAVLPTISSKNPVLNDLKQKGFTLEMFQKIFLTENKHTWGEFLDSFDRSNIVVYTRSDACGAAEMWGKYLGKNQESLLGVGVFGDPGIANAVMNDVYSIGYNNVNYAYDMKTRKKYEGLEVLPIDLNGNRVIDDEENFYGTIDEITEAIKAGRYPSPPARDLYFVANGKPDDQLVIAFLEWILEHGQQYVHEAGYVELPEESIALEKIKLQ